MAKVFTIDVPYKSISHPALVTVRSHDKDHSIHVLFFDDAIREHVREGELFFEVGSSARAAAVSASTVNRELYQIVREIVMKHLKVAAVL